MRQVLSWIQINMEQTANSYYKHDIIQFDSKEKIRNNQQTNKDVSIHRGHIPIESPQATSIHSIWKLGHVGVISFVGLPFRG